MEMAVTAQKSWFSEDADRAWAERFFLYYSPVWMAVIGLTMVTGLYRAFGDLGWLGLGVVVGVPPVILPLFLAPTKEAKAYALRFNLWVWLFGFAGNYFFTRYVMDLFGLQYRVQTVINLGALGLGKDRSPIPFVMFLLTQAYFLTYYTLIFMGYRRTGRKWPVMIALCLLMAFAETAAMASPLIKDVFWYEDKTRMLIFGSLAYGSGFIVSAPLLFRMKGDWKWSRVVIEASAAVTFQFYTYELWSALL